MNRFTRCACLSLLLCSLGFAPAAAQHMRLDAVTLNPADEDLIFTPPGFESPGKPAVANGPETGKLKIKIIDTATGKPALCRVNMIGADGNYYQPAENSLAPFSLTGTWPETLAGNRPTKAPIRYFGHFFYTHGDFTVTVPSGKVRIEVWKGLEYRPATLETKIAGGDARDLRINITRRADMAAMGWHSGDPHLHFARTTDAEDQTIFDLLEAEDVHFGSILCYNENLKNYPGMMPEMVSPQLRGLGAKSLARRGAIQIMSGQEYRNNVLGHLNLFLRDRLALEGQRLDPNIGPMFGTIGAETQAHGGYAFHAHGGYALEIWADLVQGATNGVELLQFGIYRGIGQDGWYHVLNAGFRFPGTGASDYPACRKLADCRTYVHIDGAPTFDKWLKGAAQGRSFMTTGPLVLLDVDGRLPGDTIATRDGRPRTVRARVRVSAEAAPVSDVQLIVNGEVVETVKIEPKPGASQRIELVKTVTLNESSWIAARAFSSAASGSPDGEAHTNPVYVHLNGKPPYRQADLDWLVERLDEQIAGHEARSVAQKTVPIEYFRRSRDLLLERRKLGGTPTGTTVAPPAKPAQVASPATSKPIATPGSPAESLAEFLKPVPANPPAEALKTFEAQHGFRMELVASEPLVVDPVAACFDEDGGMYVGEMIDYPYRPQDGQQPLGRVRYLQDTDGDGRYDKSSVFADHIVWPTGVVCWKGGVYVTAAPDVWYLKDTNGDHVADVKEKVYTGFGDRNQQGQANNLNWGIDHAIYGSGSKNGGDVRPVDSPTAQPIVLADRDFRFDPISRKFETISGSEQFGNAFDDWFNRFLCSESKPAYHVVLPQHYLARNSHLAVSSAIKDLAPGVTPIFRTSPIERWREVRSSRRLATGERSAQSAGLSHNVIDAAAGLTIYRGHAYPAEYRGNLFVGCSQNNLVHRRKVTPSGASFTSTRADEGTEMVRSTDIWFRPVNCINAPDGTLYVLDMSREVIESVHIAHDVVAHLDLTSGRDKGRIYRLAPPGFKSPKQPHLSTATSAELVDLLDHPGGWWRDTASRLIFERQDPSIVGPLHEKLKTSSSDVGRLHVLWALDGLASLEESDLLLALSDASAGVREHAVRLAEPRSATSTELTDKVIALADDPAARVRMQVAFTLGEVNDNRAIDALSKIAVRDVDEPWIRTAALSSCADRADLLAVALLKNEAFLSQPGAGAWLEPLATIVGARHAPEEIARLTDAVAALPADSPFPRAVLLGLGAGLQRSGQSLSAVTSASDSSAQLVERLEKEAAAQAIDPAASIGARTDAVRLLSYAGTENTVAVLVKLLSTRDGEPVQLAALRALARLNQAEIAAPLVAAWRDSLPKVQEEVIVTLASRPIWIGQLLAACESGQITVGQVPRATRTTLLANADESLRSRADKLFGGTASPRAEVIARYQPALTTVGDATRGLAVYERECVSCHKLGERGFQVGPNLVLTRNRTPSALIESILDPNREVQPNYVSYLVVDTSGRSTTGLVLAETAASVTLARDKGVTETIQKQDIDVMKSTGLSLMPEGLEKTIPPEQMADLLEFLKSVQYDIGTLPDFATPKDR